MTKILIGVLALQGAFAEHAAILRKASTEVEVIEIRNELDMKNNSLDGIIIPGGESSTMAILAEKLNLLGPLKEFGQSGKFMMGTCAGLILMSKNILDPKQGGQKSLDLLNVSVQRNYYGSQLNSFVENVELDYGAQRVYFIRAPKIVDIGADVEIVARLKDDVVAVKHGNLLASTFHPELTTDTRFHEIFLEMIRKNQTIHAK